MKINRVADVPVTEEKRKYQQPKKVFLENRTGEPSSRCTVTVIEHRLESFCSRKPDVIACSRLREFA